ncbi:MAG: hypothetical protein RL333_743 [Pseudomonadota bacterium]|jgi:hypothetical protein
MSLTYLWFQIDQLPLFSKVVGAAGFLGILLWALSFPLLLFSRFIHRLESLKGNYREKLAIKVNELRAANHKGSLFAYGLLQDFDGRAESYILAQCTTGSFNPLISPEERDQLGQDALLKLRGSPSSRTRIYAFKILALVKPQGAWRAVSPYLKNPERLEFVPAAKALLQIEMQKALRVILRLGMRHQALNRHVLGQLLEDVPPIDVEAAFIELLLEEGFGREAKLIALMPYLGEGGRLMPLRTFLPIQSRTDWLTMAIRLVNCSSQLPLVRPYLEHPESAVRFYAARAIGRHGGPSDLPALKRMMFRESPSVRSAAKSAYVSIMGQIAALSALEQEPTAP